MDESTTALLLAPAVDHIIERPRLISILEEADARTIGFFAPAGYGKTTLARQWCDRQSAPIAWYRTSRMSGDVAALSVGLDNLFAGVVELPDRDPRRIGSIASVNPTPPPLSRAFVSTYKRHVPRDLLLVLDEWEAASTAEADEFMGAVVEELDVKVLVTSRTRPPWFTARRQIYGETLEIGVEQLTMTDAEAIKVIAAEPEADTTKALLETARGWPAVLGLAALTTAKEINSESPGASTLYRFFADELLVAAPNDVQEGVMLLGLAGVENLEVARLLLGPSADSTLRHASHLGFLSVEPSRAVSVHPLLREFLVLRATEQSDDVKTRLLKDCGGLIGAARWDEALAVAEALPQQEFISAALKAGVAELLRTRGASTLRRWVTAGRQCGADAALLAYLESEVSLRAGETPKALALAELAVSTLDGDLAARAHLVAARAGYLADRSESCDDHLAKGLELAVSSETKRTVSWMRFARAVEEENDHASELLAHLASTADRSDPETLVRLAQGRLHFDLLDGSLIQGLGYVEPANAVLDRVHDPMVLTSFLNLYSNGLADCAHYEAALEAAERESTLSDEYGLDFVQRYVLINRARALIGLRRFALAQRTLSESDRRLKIDPDGYFRAHHSVLTASLFLSMGDAHRAYAAVASAPGATGRGFLGEHIAIRALTLACADRIYEATEAAHEARSISRATEVRALVAVAEASATLRLDKQKADACFDTALATGVYHAILLGLRGNPSLAEYAATRTDLRDLLVGLLIRSRDAALARRLGLAVPRSPVRSQALSPRELEIHGLIAQGLTNPEIARLLFISESTTKVHVKHILEKLGVRSRVEAARVWVEAKEPGPR